MGVLAHLLQLFLVQIQLIDKHRGRAMVWLILWLSKD